MFKLFSKFLDFNQKEVNHLKVKVELVNALADKYSKIKTPREFSEITAEFKNRLGSGETLDKLLPEAFALVREASTRAIGLRPYDVQLMAAICFHEGKIAEQKTGEGKTLSAVPALYLNALAGQGVHLVTVNDYLARRDAGWNGPTFHLLGLSVGVIMHEQSLLYDPQYFDPSHGDDRLAHLKPVTRQEAYRADVTYGTNNEFGFDYLRDNMVGDVAEMSQRGHNFAIVDEVDSILIDEARTPLIISMPDSEPTQKYYDFAKLVDRLSGDTDYLIDEKHRTANLTEHGLKKVEKMLNVENLYEKDFDTVHHVENALKAKALFILDKDYIVKDGEVIIVDEFTGRLMPGRRWSEGIHQAVEAKEGVSIQQESKTMATISFQNYFRMYKKLSGMTGTAATEAEEFQKIYKLEVIIIPTNEPMGRVDSPDVIYKTIRAKYSALATEIARLHAKGQPVLVGTTSIEKNEIVADLLRHKKIPHQTLNAKNHEKEATIISEAGRRGAVTIATNIAGRGVDIILGGTPPPNPKFVLGDDKLSEAQYKKELEKWKKAHDEVVAAGGLCVIGTERHESRRIDNQLRGRSGRQGDPGLTRFFLSLDDDIMRIFGGDQVQKIMGFLKIPEDEPIEHGMVSKAIEQAQIKVEGFNFDARKHVVEYDDVMNKQREIIYGLRNRVLFDEITDTEIITKINHILSRVVNMYAPRGIVETDVLPITTALVEIIPFDDRSQHEISAQIVKLAASDDIIKFTSGIVSDALTKRHQQLGELDWKRVVRYAYLSAIDHLWVDHLDAVDDLRSGIGLRGYGQRDPLVEYKGEAFGMFERLTISIDSEFSKRLFRLQINDPNRQQMPQMVEVRPETPVADIDASVAQAVKSLPDKGKGKFTGDFLSAMQGLQSVGVSNTHKNLGRNDPCPCGSGKKWKKCHYPNVP